MSERRDGLRLRAALAWNDTIIEDEVLPQGTPLIVGQDVQRARFAVAGPGVPGAWELLRPVPGGWVLRAGPGMAGRIRVAGRWLDLEQIGGDGAVTSEVPLTRGDHGVVAVGDAGIWFELDGRLLPIRSRLDLRRAEWELLAALALALFLHGAVLVAARLSTADTGPLSSGRISPRMVRLWIDRPAGPPPPDPDDGPRFADAGERAAGREGRAGERDAPNERPERPKDGSPKGDVRSKGALRILTTSFLGSGVLGDIFGSSDALASDLEASMQGAGDHYVAGQGTGALGIRGLGPGGGGHSIGRAVSFGPLTRGRRAPRGHLKGRGPRKVEATVRHGETTQVGGCRPSDIQRVVRARAPGIKFCYEKQLQRQPDLSGKVVAVWTIAPDGSVPRAYVSSSSLDDARVESCIRRRIRSWRFPKPAAGQCQVQYPFVFTGGI